jgi:hypothetical protein
LIVKSDSLGRFTIAFADETIAKGVGILLEFGGYTKALFTPMLLETGINLDFSSLRPTRDELNNG